MSTKRNKIENSCNRVPDLHLFPENLTRCMFLNSVGSAISVTMHMHFTIPKQRTFHVLLSGLGLNCSPIGGIVMSTSSSDGVSIRCKALLGSHKDELVTCPWECKCPGICSIAVVYISDKMSVSLCKVSDWNASITSSLNCTSMYSKYTVTTLDEFY